MKMDAGLEPLPELKSLTGKSSSLNSTQDSSLNLGAQTQDKIDIGFFATANHPIACLFHILFKGVSIFW